MLYHFPKGGAQNHQGGANAPPPPPPALKKTLPRVLHEYSSDVSVQNQMLLYVIFLQGSCPIHLCFLESRNHSIHSSIPQECSP